MKVQREEGSTDHPLENPRAGGTEQRVVMGRRRLGRVSKRQGGTWHHGVGSRQSGRGGVSWEVHTQETRHLLFLSAQKRGEEGDGGAREEAWSVGQTSVSPQ